MNDHLPFTERNHHSMTVLRNAYIPHKFIVCKCISQNNLNFDEKLSKNPCSDGILGTEGQVPSRHVYCHLRYH